MFLCSLLCLLTMAFGAESAASQVTRADYERADTILKCSDRVYSPAIHPEWIDSSHYFWYKNHEKEGDFYYLVNAESGKKQRKRRGRIAGVVAKRLRFLLYRPIRSGKRM